MTLSPDLVRRLEEYDKAERALLIKEHDKQDGRDELSVEQDVKKITRPIFDEIIAMLRNQPCSEPSSPKPE